MHNKRKIVLRGDDVSNFKIPSISPTTNKTIRFPNDVIINVEDAIKGKNCTFSAFVISAVRAALEEIKERPDLSGLPAPLQNASKLSFLKRTI